MISQFSLPVQQSLPQLVMNNLVRKTLANNNKKKIRKLFPEEPKGCCKGTKDKNNILCTDQHILNEVKTKSSHDIDRLQKNN